jgi:hypothetical protein
MRSTIVIMDTNCLRYLRSTSIRASFARQLRTIDGLSIGTTVNLIEVYRHGSANARCTLLDVVRYLTGDRPLAPWPYALMAAVGTAVLSYEDSFDMPVSGLEPFLTKQPSRTALAKLDKTIRDMENDFREMHDRARPAVQSFMRKRCLRNNWAGARAFLDEMWMRSEHIDDYIEGVWKKLKLNGHPPVSRLRDNATWRLFFEAQGVAAFEQAFLDQRQRAFGVLDLLQLIYVTGFPRSLFLSNDRPLTRLAGIVLDPVPGARVLSWQQFYEG